MPTAKSVNKPDERKVYLAFRTEFFDSEIPVKSKRIRKVVKHGETSEVKSLIQQHDVDSVVNTVQTLVNDGVFQSTLNAKLKFPELFDVSPAQSAERAFSEVEAAKHEESALQNVIKSQPNKAKDEQQIQGQQAQGQQVQGPSAHAESSKSAQRNDPASEVRARNKTSSLSLYPIYYPLWAQHQLLVQVQIVLERTCFDFATRCLPGLLKESGWDCPEAIELNIWSKILPEHGAKLGFNKAAAIGPGRSWADFWRSLADLRHTTVHRLDTTAASLEQFIWDGESLCELLRDEPAKAQLSAVRHKLVSIGEELGRNKDLVESRIAHAQKNFARRRAELEIEENKAISDLLAEDKHCQTEAGLTLRDFLRHKRYLQPDSDTDDDQVKDESADSTKPSPTEAETPKGQCGKHSLAVHLSDFTLEDDRIGEGSQSE